MRKRRRHRRMGDGRRVRGRQQRRQAQIRFELIGLINARYLSAELCGGNAYDPAVVDTFHSASHHIEPS